jgi:hypothetical protein
MCSPGNCNQGSHFPHHSMLPDMFSVECWDVNYPTDRRKVGFPIDRPLQNSAVKPEPARNWVKHHVHISALDADLTSARPCFRSPEPPTSLFTKSWTRSMFMYYIFVCSVNLLLCLSARRHDNPPKHTPNTILPTPPQVGHTTSPPSRSHNFKIPLHTQKRPRGAGQKSRSSRSRR